MLVVKIKTITKLLCGCPVGECACPYCLGFLGALPLPNRAAVDAAYGAAKALRCNTQGVVSFLRAPDGDAARGVRVATMPFGVGGVLDGEAVARVWLEEDKDGCAALCVDTAASAAALDAALAAADIDADNAVERLENESAWIPYPDLPGIRL